jgi:hypothetical protein
MRHRFKKLAGALATAALAAGLTVAGTGTAHAAVVPPTSPGIWAEIYAPEINSNHITLCVDNKHSTALFDNLQLWSCHGYDSSGSPQRWQFQFAGNYLGSSLSMYLISNASSGFCMGLDPSRVNAGTIAGSNLVQESCVSNLTSWLLVPAAASPGPSSQFLLVNAYDAQHHPYAMEANTFLDQNGNRLIAEPEDFWNSAQWFALG